MNAVFMPTVYQIFAPALTIHALFRILAVFSGAARTHFPSRMAESCGKSGKSVPVRAEEDMETTTIETELKTAGASSRQGLYAGDDAWREWFEVCFVDGCTNADVLREQVASAMYAQLARFGFTRADVEGADPVLHFDAYFMLTGSRGKPKPLKLYFKHRMAAEDRPLDEFVCGTLFGSGSGRIHDIVRDWLATAKGWKPRSVRDTAGKRHLVWERAAEVDDARETIGVVSWRPGAALDRAVLWALSHEMFSEVAKEIKVEKQSVALLCHATAHDIPITTPEVLAALGVGKSRAYVLKETCMKKIAKFFSDKGIALNDHLAAQTLLAACESALPPETLKKLGK